MMNATLVVDGEGFTITFTFWIIAGLPYTTMSGVLGERRKK